MAVASVAGAPSRNEAPGAQTFVLVHGAWHGGWCWSRVAERLRGAGHRVYTPTLTGLGERKHLISKDITLDTFTMDIANVVETEELTDIVLVGHSFGGAPISGVADAMPERIKHLVYLNSLIIAPGKTAFDQLPADIVAARLQAAQETSGGLSLPSPPASAFGVSDPHDIEWLTRRLTPHPLGTYTSKLNVKGPIGNNLPCTYISCIDPTYAALNGSRAWAKAQKSFDYVELQSGHDAMVSAPDDLTKMLITLSA